MKVDNYREMNQDELETNLEDLQRHLFDLHSQAVTENIENSRAIRNVRRDVARIKTVLRHRQGDSEG